VTVRIVDVNHPVRGPGDLPTGSRADEVWVVNDASRRDLPQRGDAELLDACHAHHPRLRAQIVALPPTTGDDHPSRAIEAAAAGSCRMIRLCPGPGGHRYPLADWVLAPLPETCEREGLAIAIDYLDHSVDPPWEDVVRFARSYPGVPVVLIGPGIGVDRAAAAALDAAANLIFETSRGKGGKAIRSMVEGFGSHRFVFGTGGTEASNDELAGELDEPDWKAILGGNADALHRGAWTETYL
jgi:predicted TIM-barrel fold metal-dependent hydrolase